MKTVIGNIVMKSVFVALILLISTQSASAYLPDNAALLYYQAFLLYEKPDDAMVKMVADLAKGKIQPNEKIKKYVEKQRNVIDSVLAAAEIPNCDWGYDYSQGLDFSIPGLATCRRLTYLTLAEARILTEQGDYRTALAHCLSIQKMARHISDRIFITHLVGISMDSLANKCIRVILAEMPADLETLNWLKDQLAQIDSLPFSIKPSLAGEKEIFGAQLQIGNKQKLLKLLSDENMDTPASKQMIDRIRDGNEWFFAKTRDYWNNYMAAVQTAMDMPYPQAYSELEKLAENMEKEAAENPDASLAGLLIPACQKIYSVQIKAKTSSNATKAAMEVYIIKAKTGKLPVTLPDNLPMDLFSDKPFEYEKTDAGFVLSCQGKDLLKNKTHEYEFKIKK